MYHADNVYVSNLIALIVCVCISFSIIHMNTQRVSYIVLVTAKQEFLPLKCNSEIHKQNTLHLHPIVFGLRTSYKGTCEPYTFSVSRMETWYKYYNIPNKFALKTEPKCTRTFAQYHYKMVEDATARHTGRGNTLQFYTHEKLLTLQNQLSLNEPGIKISNPFVRFKVQ